jgi:hypothetical protein
MIREAILHSNLPLPKSAVPATMERTKSISRAATEEAGNGAFSIISGQQ